VGHADGLGPLRLAGVDGENAAPDGLRHVRAGIDGDHQNGNRPDIVEPNGVAGKVGQAVENENRLQNHGRTTKNLNVGPENYPDQPQ